MTVFELPLDFKLLSVFKLPICTGFLIALPIYYPFSVQKGSKSVEVKGSVSLDSSVLGSAEVAEKRT